MKLRNKKTGEIINLEQWRLEYYKNSGCITITNDRNQNEQYSYGSFDDFKDDWSEYIVPEPLIKDEKIRKAVRAWAKANDIRSGRRCGSLNAYSKRIVGWNAVGTTFTIEFDKSLKMYGDSITKDDYTIDELCGEEEE